MVPVVGSVRDGGLRDDDPRRHSPYFGYFVRISGDEHWVWPALFRGPAPWSRPVSNRCPRILQKPLARVRSQLDPLTGFRGFGPGPIRPVSGRRRRHPTSQALVITPRGLPGLSRPRDGPQAAFAVKAMLLSLATNISSLVKAGLEPPARSGLPSFPRRSHSAPQQRRPYNRRLKTFGTRPRAGRREACLS